MRIGSGFRRCPASIFERRAQGCACACLEIRCVDALRFPSPCRPAAAAAAFAKRRCCCEQQLLRFLGRSATFVFLLHRITPPRGTPRTRSWAGRGGSSWGGASEGQLPLLSPFFSSPPPSPSLPFHPPPGVLCSAAPPPLKEVSSPSSSLLFFFYERRRRTSPYFAALPNRPPQLLPGWGAREREEGLWPADPPPFLQRGGAEPGTGAPRPLSEAECRWQRRRPTRTPARCSSPTSAPSPPPSASGTGTPPSSTKAPRSAPSPTTATARPPGRRRRRRRGQPAAERRLLPAPLRRPPCWLSRRLLRRARRRRPSPHGLARAPAPDSSASSP
ncbi:uncharacterized protein LOC128404585 [Podarcis raffonei]|uniref:uncharacterized protein LOC128404585 n=1 Tax=Podarcis raffonei TaxID=65483 RepID=UPI0023298D02|nr:uncharacterized protein LOC128404585 [Podarcis raffonei]